MSGTEATALNVIKRRRFPLHSQSAQASQKAAGASVKVPRTEIRLKAMSASEIAASTSAHRLQEIRHMASAATNQIAASHRDVIQSQVTTGDWLETEQPHGLDHITKTESTAASSARAANTSAMRVVGRPLALRETAIS